MDKTINITINTYEINWLKEIDLMWPDSLNKFDYNSFFDRYTNIFSQEEKDNWKKRIFTSKKNHSCWINRIDKKDDKVRGNIIIGCKTSITNIDSETEYLSCVETSQLIKNKYDKHINIYFIFIKNYIILSSSNSINKYLDDVKECFYNVLEKGAASREYYIEKPYFNIKIDDLQIDIGKLPNNTTKITGELIKIFSRGKKDRFHYDGECKTKEFISICYETKDSFNLLIDKINKIGKDYSDGVIKHYKLKDFELQYESYIDNLECTNDYIRLSRKIKMENIDNNSHDDYIYDNMDKFFNNLKL